MRGQTVLVPAALLADTSLTNTAKILWMHLRLGRVIPLQSWSAESLAIQFGFATHTVRRGLALLEASGWLDTAPNGSTKCIPFPDDLLLDRQVGTMAKLVFARLLELAERDTNTGQFSYVGLGNSPNAVKQAIRSLKDGGWLDTAQRNKFSPIQFALRNPHAERREAEKTEAALRLEEADHRGEAIMREYLTVLIDSDEFDDNASPAFLLNPYTREEMQFDRYYPPRVALEFNGPQHYRATKRYPSEAKAAKQRGRDLIKQGICKARGIELVIIHPEDLSLDGIRSKVEGLLPLRCLDDHAPLIGHLEWVSANYRRDALKWT